MGLHIGVPNPARQPHRSPTPLHDSRIHTRLRLTEGSHMSDTAEPNHFHGSAQVMSSPLPDEPDVHHRLPRERLYIER